MIFSRKNTMDNNVKRTALGVAVAAAMMMNGAGARAEPVTAYVDQFFYMLGGGKAIPPAAAGYVTYRIGARFTINPGYSCGKFDLDQNLSEAMNRIRTQLQGLPDQLSTAATAMVASLPMYLLKNYAPDIYGILTWNLDQYLELFRFQYKTCEALEQEIMNTNKDGHNPYLTATRAAVFQQYIWGADNGQSLGDTTQAIKSNPGSRGLNFVGDGRGTANNPIPIKHDLIVLAYNNRIGRTGNPLDESAPPAPQGGAQPEPLVQTWPSPKAAADWLVAATGEFWLTTEESAPKRSAPGIGIRPEIEELTKAYRQALIDAMQLNDFQGLDTLEAGGVPEKFHITDRLVKSLRTLDPAEQGVAIDRLASDTAVSIVKNKVDMATTLLRAAEQDPDVATSQIASTAILQSQKARTWLREESEEIAQMMSIEKMGSSKTPIMILSQGMNDSLRDGLKPGGTAEKEYQIGRDGFPEAR